MIAIVIVIVRSCIQFPISVDFTLYRMRDIGDCRSGYVNSNPPEHHYFVKWGSGGLELTYSERQSPISRKQCNIKLYSINDVFLRFVTLPRDRRTDISTAAKTALCNVSRDNNVHIHFV